MHYSWARKSSGGGYIMPHIDGAGGVSRERPMEYGDYVRFLRQGLVSATGMNNNRSLPLRWSVGTIGRSVGGGAQRSRTPPHLPSSRRAGHQLAPNLHAGEHGGRDARLMGAGALDTAPWRLYLRDTARL